MPIGVLANQREPRWFACSTFVAQWTIGIRLCSMAWPETVRCSPSIFAGAVSSGLVALAFVGQLSHLGTAFFVFSLVVLPTLLLMGLITFERVLQSGSADYLYALGINRIRQLYLEYSPQLRPYLMLTAHDDREGTLDGEAMHTFWWQIFLTTAGMIAVNNSVLVGSFVGLPLAAFTLPLWAGTSAGVVAFLMSGGIHHHYQWGQCKRVRRNLSAPLPGQPG